MVSRVWVAVRRCSSLTGIAGGDEAAAAHAVARHGHEDTPGLREMIRAELEDAEPVLA